MSAKVNILFQKDKVGFMGFVYVNFKNKKLPPKRISTNLKIKNDLFYKHKNKEYPVFNITKEFDYEKFNEKINEIIFKESRSKKVNDDFLSFFEKKLLVLESGATATVYGNTLKKLKKYFGESVPFSDVNNAFLFNFKTYLIKDNISAGQVKYNIGIVKNIINHANDDLDIGIAVNLKKLKLKKNHKRKDTLLSFDDVIKLLDYEYEWDTPSKENTRYFNYITLGLCQLFSCGSRFSDIIFLRWSDFKNDKIEMQTTKTKVFKTVPYTVMLLKTIFRYIYRDSQFTVTELQNMENLKVFSNEKLLKWLIDRIVRHAREQDQNDFFFAEIIVEELDSYDTSKPFTKEQYRLVRNLRTNYNNYLKNFSIENDFQHKLSSHGFRYRFVADQLEANTPIHEISEFLGHTSIATTQLYITRNYDRKGSLKLLNIADDKYINRVISNE